MRLLLGLALSVAFVAEQVRAEPIIGAYFTDWAVYAGYNFTGNAQQGQLNTVFYAFMGVATDGSLKFADVWSDLDSTSTRDKAFCAQFKVSCPNFSRQRGGRGQFTAFVDSPVQNRIISVGGGGQSGAYTYAFRYPAQFVKSLKGLVQVYGVTGIDFDYEPSSISQSNFAKLAGIMADVRRELPGFTITYPVMSSPNWIKAIGQANWTKMAQSLSYVTIMGYDLFGPWTYPRVTGLLSNLDTVDKARVALNDLGISNAQISLGVPSYGYSVSGVKSAGLGVPYSSRAQWRTLSYASIATAAGYSPIDVGLNGQIVGSYTYNPTALVFTTFDSVAAIAGKTRYTRDNGLAGVVMWELASDLPASHPLALLPVIKEVFNEF